MMPELTKKLLGCGCGLMLLSIGLLVLLAVVGAVVGG